MNIRYPVLAILLLAVDAGADDYTLDAAVGGGIGGAAGGGIGASVATDKEADHPRARDTHYEYARPRSGEPVNYFCPPGLKKVVADRLVFRVLLRSSVTRLQTAGTAVQKHLQCNPFRQSG